MTITHALQKNTLKHEHQLNQQTGGETKIPQKLD